MDRLRTAVTPASLLDKYNTSRQVVDLSWQSFSHKLLECVQRTRKITSHDPSWNPEPIDMPFGLRTRVHPTNHVLDGGPDCPIQMRSFYGKGHARACPTTYCRELCKNVWTDRDVIWVEDSDAPKEPCIRVIGVPWALQKRLNWSRRHLGYVLRWAQETETMY